MIWACAYLLFVIATAYGLRLVAPVFQRINDLHWQALVLIDIVAAFVIFWALYVAGIIAERPRSGQTISAICGGGAARGVGWAVKAAALVDALFLVLTSQRAHCDDAYRRWASPLAF